MKFVAEIILPGFTTIRGRTCHVLNFYRSWLEIKMGLNYSFDTIFRYRQLTTAVHCVMLLGWGIELDGRINELSAAVGLHTKD